jgi:hypothetical protein
MATTSQNLGTGDPEMAGLKPPSGSKANKTKSDRRHPKLGVRLENLEKRDGVSYDLTVVD